MAAIWFTQRGAADRREQPCPNRSQGVDAHLGLKGEPSCGAIPHVVYRGEVVIPQAGCTAPGLSWQEGRGVAAGEATGLEIRPWLSRGYNQPEPSAVMALPASLPSTVDPLLCSRMESVSAHLFLILASVPFGRSRHLTACRRLQQCPLPWHPAALSDRRSRLTPPLVRPNPPAIQQVALTPQGGCSTTP
ncbi:unnamed protein product [Gadus morhua 'NCC']